MGARPLRVAVDANSLAWGWSGIPRYTDRICRELVRSGDIELTLLANSSAPFADIPGVHQAWARRKGGTVWRNTFVVPWLARRRPDVYWAPETLMPLWSPTPSVVTVHDLGAALYPATKPARLRLSYRVTLPWTTRRATRVIAVSEATAVDVRRLWRVDRAKVRVAPNGVDERFRPVDRGQAAARVRRRFRLDGTLVLAVGTVEPRKGINLLVDTARAAARQGREWTFVLVGALGFRGAELAEAAKAAGCVVLGPVEDADLPDLYCAADVLVAPSLHEGFGLTPLEAMACGTPPVIAADAGALEEVTGSAAIVVRERSAAAWIAAIDEAIARRGDLGRAGIAQAAKFTWPKAARRVRETLEEAAGR